MFLRFALVLALVAAIDADEYYRPSRQTSSTRAPLIRWTMYSTPSPKELIPDGDSKPSTIPPATLDPSSLRDPLLVLDLENETSSEEANNTSSFPVYIDPKWEFSCPKRFGYYRYERSCDLYIECRNYRPFRKLCPDGMHYKDTARWTEYPCGYPSEAPCRTRGGTQPARPSAECPHQFGFYPITDKSWPKYERCSRYIVCAAGVATMMNCSIGLAFNPSIGRCDWPERVPECRDFLGFRCPVPAFGDEDMVLNYRYNADPDCRYFFSCQNGRSRLLSCELGLAFDAASGSCIDEDLVQCSPIPEPPIDGLRSTPSPLDFGYHSVPLV